MPKYSKERKHLEDTAKSRAKEKKRIAAAKLRLAIQKAGGLKAYKRKRAEAKRRVAETKKLIRSSKAEDSVIKGIMEYTKGQKPKRPKLPKQAGKSIPPRPKSPPPKRPKPKKQASNDALYREYMEAKRRRQEQAAKKKK